MSNYATACTSGYPNHDKTGYYVHNGENIFHRFTNRADEAIFVGPNNEVISEADVRADAANYEWVTI